MKQNMLNVFAHFLKKRVVCEHQALNKIWIFFAIKEAENRSLKAAMDCEKNAKVYFIS